MAATANIRSGEITVSIKVEGLERTQRAFKDIRNSMGRDIRQIAKEQAEEIVLPEARAREPKFAIPGTHIVKGRSNTTVLAGPNGKLGRIVGLLEFGGTVRKPIAPKKARAIFIPGSDHPVSVIRAPRHFKAHHYLGGAVLRKVNPYEDALARELARTWNAHIERGR